MAKCGNTPTIVDKKQTSPEANKMQDLKTAETLNIKVGGYKLQMMRRETEYQELLFVSVGEAAKFLEMTQDEFNAAVTVALVDAGYHTGEYYEIQNENAETIPCLSVHEFVRLAYAVAETNATVAAKLQTLNQS